MTAIILEIRDLKVEFPTRHASLVAVDGISLKIEPGEILGVVGESGAGKCDWRSVNLCLGRIEVLEIVNVGCERRQDIP